MGLGFRVCGFGILGLGLGLGLGECRVRGFSGWGFGGPEAATCRLEDPFQGSLQPQDVLSYVLLPFRTVTP